MTDDPDQQHVAIKAAIASSLKLKFKVLCAQRKQTMSQVTQEAIEQWIQANTTVLNFQHECSESKSEELKVYIPEQLKTQFKVLCVENKVTMRFALCNLIHQWVETNQ